jgi:hypothetical protein
VKNNKGLVNVCLIRSAVSGILEYYLECRTCPSTETQHFLMTTFKRTGFENLEKNSPEFEGSSHSMHLKDHTRRDSVSMKAQREGGQESIIILRCWLQHTLCSPGSFKLSPAVK